MVQTNICSFRLGVGGGELFMLNTPFKKKKYTRKTTLFFLIILTRIAIEAGSSPAVAIVLL